MKKRKLLLLPRVLLTLFTVFLVIVAAIIIYQHREVDYPVEYADVVEKISAEEGVQDYILYAVIFTESSFIADAVSPVGAVGLMQLLPDTAKWLCDREGVEFDEEMLVDPEFNVRHGARYLKILYDRYSDWDKAHAAYHAGFSRVDSWIEQEIIYYNEDGQLAGIPIESTQNYVNKIREVREKYKTQLDREKEKKE